jgi:hypothetical protein
MAHQALNADPTNKDAYTVIGNLYYNSYQECKKGVNEVEDRAVFFAAFEMYRKAGNAEKMKQAKEQFPLMETIHTYNMLPGDPVRVGCWINESYTVQRHDLSGLLLSPIVIEFGFLNITYTQSLAIICEYY